MTSYEIWNQYMKCYDFLANVGSYMRNLEDIVVACGPHRNRRILDAGSGTGNLSIALHQKGARVKSFDFSPEAIAVHLQKDPSADVCQGSLEEPLPFPAGTFDVVCCASVLFALSREGCQLALNEFRRVLAPGGQLVVTVAGPSKKNSVLLYKHLTSSIRAYGWIAGIRQIAKTSPSLFRVLYYNRKLQELPDWEGYHRFTPDELRAYILAAGFEEPKLQTTYGDSFLLAHARVPELEKAQHQIFAPFSMAG